MLRLASFGSACHEISLPRQLETLMLSRSQWRLGEQGEMISPDLVLKKMINKVVVHLLWFQFRMLPESSFSK